MATKTKTAKKAVKPVPTTEMTAITQALGIPNQGDDVAAGRKPVGDVSAKEATLAVFRAAQDKEFKTDEVVAAVHKTLPKSKKETILWMMTELKKAGQIHRVRNDGHQHVLKFGPGSAPKITSTQPVFKGKAGDDTLSVLKKLTALVEQRAQIDAEIERLKKLI